nr:hypothetical protein [Tanacetum cinerariifolium]
MVKTVNEDVLSQALVDGKKVILNEAFIRRDLRLDDAEGTVFRAITPLFDPMMAQAPEEVSEGSTIPTETHHTPIVTQPSSSQPQKKQKSRRKHRKETDVPHSEPQKESVPTLSNDPLYSGEDIMQLTKLMNLCTNLQKQVLDLEKAKIAQAKKIADLKKRVKKQERKKKSRTSGLKRLYKIGLSARIVSSDEEGLGDQEDASKQGRIAETDANEDLFLINETAQDQGRMNEEDMFGVHDLDGDEVIVDVTAGENVEQDAIVAKKEAKDKGKGIMVEPKKPLKKKDQITNDKKIAKKLEAQMKAEMEEEERIAREKVEANIDVVEQ